MSDRSNKISKLLENASSRASYIRSKLNVNIPSQIRASRRRRDWTQGELAQIADMKQSRISAIETPGAVKFNLETLIRLAAAFRVGLQVKFVPFSEMLRWENWFSQDTFDVTTIENDTEFLNPEAARQSQAEAREDAAVAALRLPIESAYSTTATGHFRLQANWALGPMQTLRANVTLAELISLGNQSVRPLPALILSNRLQPLSAGGEPESAEKVLLFRKQPAGRVSWSIENPVPGGMPSRSEANR